MTQSPRVSEPPQRVAGLPRWAWPLISLFAGLCILALCKSLLGDLLLQSQGYVLALEESVVSAEVVAGETAEIPVTIRNITGDPINIVGLESSCACASATQLPMVVAPHATNQLVVRVTTSPREVNKTVVQHVRLFIDKRSPAIVVELRVNVADLLSSVSDHRSES